MSVGKNIKKIRSFKKLSQQAFGDIFGMKRANISAYEDNRAKPKMEITIEIANFFNIPLELFLKEELSINQLAHFDSNVDKLQEKKQSNSFGFEIRYFSVSDANKFLNDIEGFSKETLPIISFPFPVNGSEFAFQVGEDVFINRLETLNIDDIIFCCKVKDVEKLERGNYLILLKEKFLISELMYDPAKNCLVNPANELEKLFPDEYQDLYKITSVLSSGLMKKPDEITEMRKALKRLDKYLKI